VVRTQDHLVGLPFDDTLIDLLTNRSFHTVIAPVILATEIVIGLGLWHRRTRLAAVWLCVAFHLSIEISASVQTFSLTGISALSFWVTPERRRHELRGGPTGVRSLLRRLDWYARFDHRDAGGRLSVRDPDGRRYERGAAWARVAMRLPVSAWPLGLPAGGFASLRRTRRP
jgi:hypothetical protein